MTGSLEVGRRISLRILNPVIYVEHYSTHPSEEKENVLVLCRGSSCGCGGDEGYSNPGELNCSVPFDLRGEGGGGVARA